jgi:hypothetical protein
MCDNLKSPFAFPYWVQLNRDIFGQRFDLSGAEFVSRRSHRSSIALPQRPVNCIQRLHPAIFSNEAAQLWLARRMERRDHHLMERHDHHLWISTISGYGAAAQSLPNRKMKTDTMPQRTPRRPGQKRSGQKRPGQNTNTSKFRRPESQAPQNARRNYDRYLALAQAEARSGDWIAAENYYQHAEHYFRTMHESAARDHSGRTS